jgi:hypothetical protein
LGNKVEEVIQKTRQEDKEMIKKGEESKTKSSVSRFWRENDQTKMI